MARLIFWLGIPALVIAVLMIKLKPQQSQKILDSIKQTAGVEDNKNEIPEGARKVNPVNAADFKMESLDPEIPFLKFEYKEKGTIAVIPADDILTGVPIYKGYSVRIHLGHSAEFDTIRMFGSDSSDFNSANLIFDWTARDVSSFTFEAEFFKYKYYQVRWQSLISGKKKKEANFFIQSSVAQSPVLVLTYQPFNTGPRMAELSYLQDSDKSDQITRLPGLRVKKDSLLGMKIVVHKEPLDKCIYTSPDQKTSDCRTWAESDFIGNISDQDRGWHRVDLKTSLGQFQYHFEIQSLE